MIISGPWPGVSAQQSCAALGISQHGARAQISCEHSIPVLHIICDVVHGKVALASSDPVEIRGGLGGYNCINSLESAGVNAVSSILRC